MAYRSTGMMAMFPIYLQRMPDGEALDAANGAIAQNEINLNQNLEELTRKILELEAYLLQTNEEAEGTT